MTDRSPTTAEDNLVLGRQTAAEINAAVARVRAHFDDGAPLLIADVRTLLADHAHARVNIGDLQYHLRGERHHHANDVERLTTERDQTRAAIRQALDELFIPLPNADDRVSLAISRAVKVLTAIDVKSEPRPADTIDLPASEK